MCRSETPIFSCLLDRDPNAPGHLTGHSICRPERYRMQCYPTRPFLFSLLFFCVCSIFYFFDGGLLLLSSCFVCSAVLFAAAKLLAWLQKKETLRQPCWPPCIYQKSHCFVFSCIYQADQERVCRLPVTPLFVSVLIVSSLPLLDSPFGVGHVYQFLPSLNL
ncbi:hypothetical protein V8C43DRAFT_104180 [Trichoderma afarasin]